MKKLKIVALVGVLAISTSVFAEQAKLTLTSKSYQEIYEMGKNGKKRLKYIGIDKVLPGDVVLYKNTIDNFDNKSANNMVLQNPIPKHTQYVPSSAKCESPCEVLYSVDGGKVYDSASKLMITDGDTQRLALPSEYTNVKWILKTPLKPSSSTYVSFRTKLK